MVLPSSMTVFDISGRQHQVGEQQNDVDGGGPARVEWGTEGTSNCCCIERHVYLRVCRRFL